jgi:hypothetical protein
MKKNLIRLVCKRVAEKTLKIFNNFLEIIKNYENINKNKNILIEEKEKKNY